MVPRVSILALARVMDGLTQEDREILSAVAERMAHAHVCGQGGLLLSVSDLHGVTIATDRIWHGILATSNI